MNGGLEASGRTREVVRADALFEDSSLVWYKVVGIEFLLFAGILVPLICGALLAR